MIGDKIYYFDYAATTPMDPAVIDSITLTMKNVYGNPNSNAHKIGWESFDVLEKARYSIAKFINAKSDEIIFTSGATESNNIGIKGYCDFYKSKGDHIVTMSTEHKCVLNSIKYLEQNEGFTATYLDPEIDGLLDLNKLKEAVTEKTILVSIMLVNNETGVIQNIKEISKLIKSISPKIGIHVDAAQGFGKIPIDVQEMGVDLMSVSGHKIYGAKGVGFLYIRKEPRIRLTPLIQGGGQERGIRNGTQALPLIVGLQTAIEIAKDSMDTEFKRYSLYRKRILDELLAMEDVYLNGSLEHSIPNIINISVLHVEGESLMMSMPEICLSTGSACNSSSLDPSYVITAMRKDTYYAHSAMRISFGRFTTDDDINFLINRFKFGVNKMRSISPLWEMKKKGIDINSIKWDESHH